MSVPLQTKWLWVPVPLQYYIMQHKLHDFYDLVFWTHRYWKMLKTQLYSSCYSYSKSINIEKLNRNVEKKGEIIDYTVDNVEIFHYKVNSLIIQRIYFQFLVNTSKLNAKIRQNYLIIKEIIKKLPFLFNSYSAILREGLIVFPISILLKNVIKNPN